MMVTVTQINDGVDGEGADKFPPILGKLEAKGMMPEEKIEAYKALTEKLYKDNFQAFLAEFNQSGSRLVNIFCVDVMSPTPDISQAALQAVGFCIYHDEIISILSESDIDILLKALQNVLLKTSDKGTCTRALWCIAKQSFPVHHVKDHLHGLLCSLEHVLVNGDFKSVTVEHEAINAIIKLLESLPDEMLANTLRWAKLILPSLVHSAVKVRTRAMTAVELAMPAMVKFSQELAPTVVHDLKTRLISEMNKLFVCKHELYVLKIWGYFVTILGKTMHRGGSLINLMLGIAEQGFKHPVTEVKVAVFNAWKILIENFALDPDVLYNQKRIKLLVQPLKVNNAKAESVAMVKFDVWWFLIRSLGPKAAINFDQVCAPLLQFSLGLGPSNGVHLPPTSGTGNGIKHLLSTPVHRKGSATPSTPTLNLSVCSPGPVHPVFKSIQLRGVEALAHILGKWDSCSGLPKPCFTLESLKYEIITSPTLFNKLGHTLLQAATVVCCSLATDVAHPLIFHIWYSIVAHLKNLIDNTPRNESSDMMSHFFMCIQSIVKAETLSKCTVLRLLEAVSALPKKALSSSFFTTGTVQLLHGTPALFLIGLLFSDCLVHDLEERFFCIFKALVDCGMTTPGGALGFSQSVFSLVDTATGKISNKETVWRLWNIVVNPLLNEIEKTDEVNQGDSLEHDFSTMYAALTLPIKHILPNTIHIASQKSLLKTWTEVYRAFARCSALVATAEANHACEELATKMVKLLDDNLLSNLPTLDALSQMYLVMIQSFDFSALNETQGLMSPHKRAGLSRRPLGNLTSYTKVLCQVLYAVNKETLTVNDNGTNGVHFMSAMNNLLEVLANLVGNLTMPKHLIALLDKVVRPVADFYDLSSSKCVGSQSQISSLEDKLKKFLVDLFNAMQSRVKGQFDNKLLAIMSPILEKTLIQPKRNIKSPSVQFWNATFGKAKHLDYPENIKPVLKKVKEKTPLSLPGWPDMGVEIVEETPVSQLNDTYNNSQSFVEPAPIIRPFGTPSPRKMHGSFLRKESEKLVTITSPRRNSPARAATASPNIMSASKGTRRRLNIDEDRKLKFVKIAASPKKKLILTEHQKEVMRERGVVPTMYNDLDQSQDTQLFSNMFSQTQDNTNSSFKDAITEAIDSCKELTKENTSPSSNVKDDDLPQHSDCPLLEEAVGPEFFWRNTSTTDATKKSEEPSTKKVNFADTFGATGSLRNGGSSNNCVVTGNTTDVNMSVDKQDCISPKTDVKKTDTNENMDDEVMDSEINNDVCSEVVNTPEKSETSNNNVPISPVVSIAETQDIVISTQDNESIVVQLEPHLTPEKTDAGGNVEESPLVKKLKATPVLKLLRMSDNVEKMSPANSKAFRCLDIASSPKVFGSQAERESVKKQSLRRTKSADSVCRSPDNLHKSVSDTKDSTCKRLNCTQDDLAKLAEKFEFDDIRPLNDDSENEQSELNGSEISESTSADGVEKTKTGAKKTKKSNVKKDDTPVKRSARKAKSKKLESIDENDVKSLKKLKNQEVEEDKVQLIKTDSNEVVKPKGRRGRKRKINSDSIESVESTGDNKVDNKHPVKSEKRESKRRKKTASSDTSVAMEDVTKGSAIQKTDISQTSVAMEEDANMSANIDSSSVCDVDVDSVSFNSCEDMFAGMGGTQEPASIQETSVDQKHVEEPTSIAVSTKTKIIKTYGKQPFLEVPSIEKDIDTNSDKQSEFESEDDLTLAEIKECYLDGDSQDSIDEEILKTENSTKELLPQISDDYSAKESENSEDDQPISELKTNKKQSPVTKSLKFKSTMKKKSPESIFSKKALKLAMRSPAKRITMKSPVKPSRTSSGRLVVLPRRLRSQTAPVAARLRSKSGDVVQSRRITPVKRRCSTPKSLTRKQSFFEGVSNEPLNSQEYKMFSLEETSSKDVKPLPVISESPEKIVQMEIDDVEKEKVVSNVCIDLPVNTDLDVNADPTVLKENIPNICDSWEKNFVGGDLVDFDDGVKLNTEVKPSLPENVESNKESAETGDVDQIDKEISKNQIEKEDGQTSSNIDQEEIFVDPDNQKDNKKDNANKSETTSISLDEDATDSSNQKTSVADIAVKDVPVEDNAASNDVVADDELQRIFEDADDPEDIIDSSQSPLKSVESDATSSRLDVLKQTLDQIQKPARVTMSSSLAKSISSAVENLATSPVIPVKFCQFDSPPESSSRKCAFPEHAIPGVFSPRVSPSTGILKRQPGSSNSPSPKTRRVSFAEPIEQLDSDAKAAADGGKNVNRCLEMNRQQLPTSPLVTTTPSKVVNVNSRYITTPSSSRGSRLKSVSCGGKRFRKSPGDRRKKLRDFSHASPRLVRKAFHLNGSQVSQDSPLTQGSPGSGFDSELDEFDPQMAVFPHLVNCTAPVVKILPKLTSSMWSRGLGQLIRARNIITVGHLSALTPTDLKTLPIRSPKVKTVKNALETFRQQLIAKEEKEGQQNVVHKERTLGKEESSSISANVENSLKNTGTVVSELDQLSEIGSSPAMTGSTENQIEKCQLHNEASVSNVNGDGNLSLAENSAEQTTRPSLKRKLEETTPGQSPKKCKLIDNLEELTSEFVKEDLSQLSSEQIFRAHQQVSSLMTSIVQALRSKCQSPK